MSAPDSGVSFEKYGGKAPENYERYFVPAIGTPFANDLLAVARPRSGERVLDVACGTGIVARLAAERIGPDGTVAGLDMNPGMLAVARTAAQNGAAIEWHEASAESLPLADSTFDVVLCSLGLQFVPDKLAALREMHRVLAPGGRVAINAVGPTPPSFAILEQAVAHHVTPEATGFLRAVFSLHDPQELQDLLDAAGFRDVAAQVKTLSLALPAPEEFLWQYVWSTPLAEALKQIDDEGRSALERDVVEGWQTFVEGGALLAEQRVVVATAVKRS